MGERKRGERGKKQGMCGEEKRNEWKEKRHTRGEKRNKGKKEETSNTIEITKTFFQ